LEAPFDPYDFERNQWADSSEPELVRKLSNLLVEEKPNQWNTERTEARPYPSSTSSLASYPSGFSEIDAVMSAEKRPQLDTPLADAGPSGYGRRQAQPGPSTSTRGQYWADTEENNPSQFFKPSTHFTTLDGTQYPYTPYAPAQARPTPTQTLEAENEQLRKAIEAERQMRRDAEARLQQRATNTPAAAQFQEARPEEFQQRTRGTPAPAQFQKTRLEGLQQSRHAPSVAQEGGDMPDQAMTQQQYQTNLLKQLAQLQIRLANDRMDTRPNTRGSTNLKPADIGYLEPKAMPMPDSEAAMNFIESFSDAVM
jgi:uncharacterized membrane protein